MRSFEQVQLPVWLGGLAGLIPFYGALYGQLQLAWPASLFISYAWIILAFLCGSVWRSALNSSPAAGLTSGISIALGVPALLWLSAWVGVGYQLALSAAGFLMIYVWERRYCWSDFPAGYRVLRTTLTTGVLLAHLALAVLG